MQVFLYFVLFVCLFVVRWTRLRYQGGGDGETGGGGEVGGVRGGVILEVAIAM